METILLQVVMVVPVVVVMVLLVQLDQETLLQLVLHKEIMVGLVMQLVVNFRLVVVELHRRLAELRQGLRPAPTATPTPTPTAGRPCG